MSDDSKLILAFGGMIFILLSAWLFGHYKSEFLFIEKGYVPCSIPGQSMQSWCKEAE